MCFWKVGIDWGQTNCSAGIIIGTVMCGTVFLYFYKRPGEEISKRRKRSPSSPRRARGRVETSNFWAGAEMYGAGIIIGTAVICLSYCFMSYRSYQTCATCGKTVQGKTVQGNVAVPRPPFPPLKDPTERNQDNTPQAEI